MRAKFNREPDAIAASPTISQGARRRDYPANSTEGPKLRDALATADVVVVTGRLKINAKRNVDKPAVIQEVTYAEGAVKFVYKTTINPN